MTAISQFRGHPIHWDEQLQGWRFTDTGLPTVDTHHLRPCGHCGRHDTPEGHDGCLGTLPGVMNACCGHGVNREAYVQYPSGFTIRGYLALRQIAILKFVRRKRTDEQ